MTQSVALSNSETLTITPAAAKFLMRMLRFGGGGSAGLRLEVKPGGCSGMSSQLSVEAAPLSGDEVLELQGLRLFVPPASVRLLSGVTIDFLESATEARLAFLDPKAGPCGCSSTSGLPKGTIPLS